MKYINFTDIKTMDNLYNFMQSTKKNISFRKEIDSKEQLSDCEEVPIISGLYA